MSAAHLSRMTSYTQRVEVRDDLLYARIIDGRIHSGIGLRIERGKRKSVAVVEEYDRVSRADLPSRFVTEVPLDPRGFEATLAAARALAQERFYAVGRSRGLTAMAHFTDGTWH